MSLFLQGIVSSLSVGSMYSLLALATSMLYGSIRTANFAMGEFFMIGILVAYSCFVTSSMPFVVSLAIAVIVAVLVLVGAQKLLFEPMLNTEAVYLMICTLGVSTFLKSFAQIVFGSEAFNFPTVFGDKPINLGGGVLLVPQNLAIIIMGIILMLALGFFMSKTKTGIAIQAVAMNRRAASLMGINHSMIITISFAIAAFLAAMAGVFSAPVYKAHAYVGSVIGLKSIVAAIMGGLGNMYGAILGGMLLGLVETLGSLYISSAYKDAFAYILLVVILLIRPQGILGQKRISKV